ncbi:MAG: sugar phosphate isomerase/epimerase, partial [archaeon]|nr:sugar phosphate isomerase/epimerase [archaeon]MCR4323618.1 sugar phosphate isomerase/epimerase [Nanoarchaeota archaeon]
MGKESYESFYGGGGSSFNPSYFGGFGEQSEGYGISPVNVGFPGSAQTANQLMDTVNAIKSGTKTFEVSILGMNDLDQSIPKQHFAEMRALMRLSGVKPSVHGNIMVDPSGFGQAGWTGGESERKSNERRMFQSIEKAHDLDPKGNTPVVFHASSSVPGRRYGFREDEKGNRIKILEKSTAINLETGQATALETENKFRPERPDLLDKGGKPYYAKDQLDAVNVTNWESKMTELASVDKQIGEVIGTAREDLRGSENAFIRSDGKVFDVRNNKPIENFDENKMAAANKLKKADIFLDNIRLNFVGAFDKAYKYGTPEQQKELKNLSIEYSNQMKNVHDVNGGVYVANTLAKKEIHERAIEKLNNITRKGEAPKIFVDAQSYATKKAAETFGNMATSAYKNYGKNAPVITIENLPEHMAFSDAEGLRDLINESRKVFVENMVNGKKMSKGAAIKIAEKHIGATWDVGHINTLRKHGYSEKDIIEQTKVMTKDKSMVKHVHLSDNFGYSDSELPPGMGTAPIKEMLKELEKTGRLKEMRKIIEGGGRYIAQFKSNPMHHNLGIMGSGIYGMKAGPAWSQIQGGQGSYFGGYGTINPELHHSIYGAGFTTMPIDLGGQMPGGRSRFGGAPMS